MVSLAIKLQVTCYLFWPCTVNFARKRLKDKPVLNSSYHQLTTTDLKKHVALKQGDLQLELQATLSLQP